MKQKGQSLIEIVIALGIFIIITSGIITLSLGALISERQGGEITQATFFMQQGAEATRSIRDLAYNKLAYYSDGLTHGIDNSSGAWEWSGLNNIKDQFTRTIKIEDVTRDINGNIGAGTNDLETKKITVSSDWSFALGRANQVQSIFYLTNWNRGLWIEDTVADFSDGIFNNTEVTNDSGGEIKLTHTVTPGSIYGNSFLVESTSGVGNINNASTWTSNRFTAQASKTVSAIRIYIQTEQGVSPTYRYGLQADSTGNPSGIYLGSGDLAATTTGWQTINLGTPVALTSGTIYHLVVKHQSGTINNSRYVSIRKSAPQNVRIPYNNVADINSNVLFTTNSGGIWTAQNAQPIYILQYNDSTFEGDPYFQSAIVETATTNFQGERFLLANNISVSDISFYVRQESASEPQDNLNAILHDVTNNLELANIVLATPAQATTSFAWITANFASPINLVSGNEYRIYLTSPGTANNRSYQIHTMDNMNDASDNSINYLSTNSRYSFSNNSGTNWTEANNQDVAYRFQTQTSNYQTSGTYESSEFGPVSNFNLIKWSEIIPSVNEDLQVQIKTAPDNAGVPGAWYPNWCGPLGKIGNDTNFFTDANGQIINPNIIGDSWIKYKLTLTGNGTNTPVLQSHTVNYRP